MEYKSKLLKSVFLIILAVSGNFVGNTLGCQTQSLLTSNMYVKNILLLFIIYFTISFTDDDKNNPVDMLINSFYIWLLFILFTKQKITTTIILFILFFISYFLNNYITYYERIINENKDNIEHNKKLNNIIKKLEKIKNFIYIIELIILICGFLYYLCYQYNEYNKDFNFIKFIFGKPNCDKIKN
jgi:hypothetical protein